VVLGGREYSGGAPLGPTPQYRRIRLAKIKSRKLNLMQPESLFSRKFFLFDNQILVVSRRFWPSGSRGKARLVNPHSWEPLKFGALH
jgi:hypothetical protein